MTLLQHLQHASDVITLAAGGDKVPNPPAKAPDGMTGPRDMLLGFLKWGGYAVAVGSLIVSGIKMAASGGGRGATTAADAALEIPWKIVGAVIIGAGAGILGQFLGG